MTPSLGTGLPLRRETGIETRGHMTPSLSTRFPLGSEAGTETRSHIGVA